MPKQPFAVRQREREVAGMLIANEDYSGVGKWRQDFLILLATRSEGYQRVRDCGSTVFIKLRRYRPSSNNFNYTFD